MVTNFDHVVLYAVRFANYAKLAIVFMNSLKDVLQIKYNLYYIGA